MQIAKWRFGIAVLFAAVTVSIASQSLAAEPFRTTYMVALSGAPLVADAQKRTVAQAAGAMAARDRKQAIRSALASTASMTYLRGLDVARNAVLDLAGSVTGRVLTPTQVYRYATNGMALELSDAEAASLATLPGVRAVRKERIEHINTDAGPQWIGADALWNGQAGIAASKGEGVVIGVIDTGINPAHPSFAASAPDGYSILNARGHFYGLCSSGQATCNNKLIGIYDFSDEGTRGVDADGHGSHVSGIAAGNAITASLHGTTANVTRQVSGVAPHANLIMYKACNSDSAANQSGSCNESWLVGAIDQAIADNVDVINYSIGGGTVDPYTLLGDTTSDAYAFYNARAAGIVIAVSAGNSGPGANTIDEPSNAPWVIGVANASHNRRFVNALTALTGAASAPADLTGQSLSGGFGPASIVYAGNYGNALCGKGTSEGVAPTGASNPFAPGTFHGEIVVCDRGIYARVEKGYNVLAAGAGGMVLANASSDGESVVADDHFLPAVHLGYSEGAQLKQWLTVGGTHTGTITAASAGLASAFGDILDASSSRGPYGFSGGILKPDITAPGQNILSASRTGASLAILTGTSMASPHVAGSAALVLAAHPDWNPSQVESALIGTALANSVRLQDGTTLATPLAAGAGRVQPALAATAGLYLPISAVDYYAANGVPPPDAAHHGDLRRINRLGLEDEHCFQTCAFTRTVADMSGGGTWQVTTSGQGGTKIVVTPDQFTLAAGASQALAITVDVSDPHLPGTWTSGRILLHKINGSPATDIALTAAVFADPGAAPPFADIVASAPTGVATLSVGGLPQLPQATYLGTALVTPDVTTLGVAGVDADPSSRYAAPTGAGRQFFLLKNPSFFGVDVSVAAQALIVEVAQSNAPSTTIYVGVDANGDGQAQQSEEVCHGSTDGVGPARCVVDMRNSGKDVWVVVDVTQGTPTASYMISLASGFPVRSFSPSGQLTVGLTGPGHVPASTNFPLRLSWDRRALGPLVAGQRYFGAALIMGAPDATSSALLPFAITYQGGNDDLQDALNPNGGLYLANAAQTFHYLFVDVPPGTSTLEIDSGLYLGGNRTGSVALGLVRADFPASAASPHVVAAPATAPATTWNLTTAAPNQTTTWQVSPGRWYVVAQTSAAAEFQLSTRLTYNTNIGSALQPVAMGAYYNPQRSGHGIFLSRASDQQALDWYTYLEDGTPTWYQAQAGAPSPDGSVWNAPLYRVNWDGSKVNSRNVVGDVTLTPINASDLIFSWHLDGQAGSERFTRLGAGPCPTFNATPTNFNGAWYAPAQSGYGMDVVALPDLQFAAFYFYDDIGLARWGSGAATPFALNSTIDLTQNHGFCPVCDYVAVTTQPLGTLTVNYSSANAGTYASALVLKNPLSGNWAITQPIARLTGSPVCSP